VDRERRRLSPEDRRAQLVALGVAALADRPLDALSIESLSAQAGVSRGLLFHYFGSLQGLHREVVMTARDALLHATEPVPGLPPLERLDDTLTRVVRFVREHSGTFYSLVRGVAAGDPAVREVVEQARQEQADRLRAVFVELGAPDDRTLSIALRAWVSFAEHSLIAMVIEGDEPDDEIVAFLDRSARAVAAAVDRQAP
jgi:AcrR family transcriptional regulator